MKTKPTTRVSFSDNPPAIDVKMPVRWEDLSQDELRTVFRVMEVYTDRTDCIPFQVFRLLACMEVVRQDDSGFLCCFTAGHGRRARVRHCWITPETMAETMECLAFLAEPGDVPVRLDYIGRGRRRRAAVNAQLHEVSFRDYVKLENLYQGFLRSNDQRSLTRMAAILYPRFNPEKDFLMSFEVLAILQWMVQVKAMFARLFRYFFRPAAGTGEAPNMMEVLNNEIRALTQGDVTKEAEILETDCWRALTELDYKAKEAEEFNRAKSKSK